MYELRPAGNAAPVQSMYEMAPGLGPVESRSCVPPSCPPLHRTLGLSLLHLRPVGDHGAPVKCVLVAGELKFGMNVNSLFCAHRTVPTDAVMDSITFDLDSILFGFFSF